MATPNLTVYKRVTKPAHPNANASGQLFEHVYVMSEMIGRPLTTLEVVHHIDEDKGNNHPTNLQLFATSAEHLKHHAEERALAACGNRFFMKCVHCKEYDEPQNMENPTGGRQRTHKSCRDAYNKAYLTKKRNNKATNDGN